MSIQFRLLLHGALYLFIGLTYSCGRHSKPEEKDIVVVPDQMDVRVSSNIFSILAYARENKGFVADSTYLQNISLVDKIYSESPGPIWTNDGNLQLAADSLINFISTCRYYGLFSSDYHYPILRKLQSITPSDSMERRNAMNWSRLEVLSTDAFFSICKHLSRGRIPVDTLTSRRDTLLSDDQYIALFRRFMTDRKISSIAGEIEPKHLLYTNLKNALRSFLDSADFKSISYLYYPYNDSSSFYRTLNKRLKELKFLEEASLPEDTSVLRIALKSFQQSRKLKPTGKINPETVSHLNDSDIERFKTIALSLDKLKLLSDTLPSNYVWVNIPAYNMKVIDSDSVRLSSRVIVGAPKTRTPELNSEISNFVIYPQWTVPYSIVFGEMLPQIRKDIRYLEKQNLMIVDNKENVVDPATIDWKKVGKQNFPYQIKQRQGDDNSLGVLKFNFRNKYSVYLHDTNTRWLFSKSSRALSHGCVRVQQWKDLAGYLVRNDTSRYPADSLNRWLSLKEKKTISGFAKVPIYIRYFTCEAVEGKIRFYEDVYQQDRIMREKYFQSRYLN